MREREGRTLQWRGLWWFRGQGSRTWPSTDAGGSPARRSACRFRLELCPMLLAAQRSALSGHPPLIVNQSSPPLFLCLPGSLHIALAPASSLTITSSLTVDHRHPVDRRHSLSSFSLRLSQPSQRFVFLAAVLTAVSLPSPPLAAVLTAVRFPARLAVSSLHAYYRGEYIDS